MIQMMAGREIVENSKLKQSTYMYVCMYIYITVGVREK